jgi:DNA invertase Pin-like site-specific DNA recombinase
LQLLNSRVIELTIGRSLSQSWFGALTVSPAPLNTSYSRWRSFGRSVSSSSAAKKTSTPAARWGQALFTIVSAVAQLERDLIRERVSAGIRNARANGKKLGRPRVKANLEEILQLKAEGHSLRKIAAKLGIGDGTVRDRLKDQRGRPHAKGPS